MAIITVNIDEDLYDIANRVYGHPLGVHWLVEDNNLGGVTSQIIPGQNLIVRASRVELLPIKSGNNFMVQNELDYELDEYQSVFDLVIEKHGSIEGVYELLEQNKLDGLTEYMWHLRPVKVSTKPYNKQVQNYLKPYMPIATISEVDKSGGIGFMYLERNFLVR